MAELVTPEGRIVKGHPMKRVGITKKNEAGQDVKKMIDGPNGTQVQATETFVAFAIPKNGSTDWKTTPWGQVINAQALQDWPNGETNTPTFSWKIIDGDSQIPNKNMNKPCDQEGYPGNWVLILSTQIPYKCFKNGNYTDALIDVNEIKTGDYGRFKIVTTGNNAPRGKTPGMYMNPVLFSMDREGALIVGTSEHNAADAFGGGATTTQPPAAQAPAADVPPPPATDIVDNAGNPPPPPAAEPMWIYNGQPHPRSFFAGWTDEQVNTLPRA